MTCYSAGALCVFSGWEYARQTKRKSNTVWLIILFSIEGSVISAMIKKRDVAVVYIRPRLLKMLENIIYVRIVTITRAEREVKSRCR